MLIAKLQLNHGACTPNVYNYIGQLAAISEAAEMIASVVSSTDQQFLQLMILILS